MIKLVLGGAKSGKSRFAQSLCRDRENVVFVAKASVGDDPEMAARIERHRRERPSEWHTVETHLDVVSAVKAQSSDATVLLDCVTVWLSNLMFEHRELLREERERRILEDVSSLISESQRLEVVVVSNEVGGGVVPETLVGREFRDLQGLVNQKLARDAARSWLVVAGLPMELSKG